VAPRYIISEESWKHHAQARAILGNLIGPNGEQLTSTDPYNTTVFVGGLSPLISEETLRTFFTPFGEIHYVRVSLLRYWWDANIAVFVQVKVPVGKHCGFVQFVRKADAERAIDKMQGFPIGGSRIRLSWGRSQCASSCIVTRPTD
jgi:RNA recognition motif-containing protein